MNGDSIGPALGRIAIDDDEALQALFREQRARLQVVRDNRIWQWFGGVPFGFGKATAVLHAVYLQLAFVVLAMIVLIVAGFTRGPVLWGLLALAASCLVARAILIGPPTRKALALYRRAVLAPAVVVAFEVDTDHDDELQCVSVLMSATHGKPADAAALSGLVQAGDRLRRFVGGAEPSPSSLQELVGTVRRRLADRDHDGSRVVVPAGLDAGAFEIAFLRVSPRLLPRESLTSRLLFVFADPERQHAGHTRVVQSSVWGEGAASLCDTLPLAVV